MEISRFSLLDKYNDKPTKSNTKSQAVGSRNYAALPDVSPVYYSPSFMGKPFEGPFEAWTYCDTDKLQSPFIEISMARSDKFEIWSQFLRNDRDYSKKEKTFIVDEMFKYCEAENYVVVPDPDKEVLGVTWDKYCKRKENGSEETFDFNLEYRKELQLKDWRKNLLAKESKYDTEMCLEIINSLAESNEPENIPPYDKVIFDITMNQYNETRNTSDGGEEIERFDFNRAYKTNLKRFTDDADRVLGVTDTRSQIYIGAIRKDLETRSTILPDSQTSKPRQISGSSGNNQGDDIDTTYIQTLMQDKTKQTIISSSRGVFADVYKLTSCGNNNYVGGVDGIDEERLAESGFKTFIDLNARSGKGLTFWKNEHLTEIHYDIQGYGEGNEVWNNPAFREKSLYEFTLLDDLEKYSKYLKPYEIEQKRERISKNLDEFDIESREFIDDFTTVMQYLNEGYCYMGCYHGRKVSADMLLLNYYFNPKSDYGGTTVRYILEDADTGRYMTVPSFARIAYSIKNLYDKLTPEDKKKMGWDEEFDKKFKARLYEDVRGFGENEVDTFNFLCG